MLDKHTLIPHLSSLILNKDLGEAPRSSFIPPKVSLQGRFRGSFVQNMSTIISTDDTAPWYALRLFKRSMKPVKEYLNEKQLIYFIPMNYRERVDKDGKTHRELVPVVSNLIFLKKTATEKEIVEIISECNHPVSFLRRQRYDVHPIEIPSNEMKELIYVCNPDKINYKYIDDKEAALKTGSEVIVTRGPLQGVRGKLVRSNHLYYIIRSFTGLSLMLKVSRWCCKGVND